MKYFQKKDGVWQRPYHDGNFRWIELSIDVAPKTRPADHERIAEDNAREEPPNENAEPEPAPSARVTSKRGRVPLSSAQRKARQREREQLRATIAHLTPDEEIVAKVVDRQSYVLALIRLAERERRRQDDIVEFRIKLVADETARWVSTGVETTRIIAQCFEETQRLGNGARPRSQRRDRLRESAVLTIIESEPMYSEPPQAMTKHPLELLT